MRFKFNYVIPVSKKDTLALASVSISFIFAPLFEGNKIIGTVSQLSYKTISANSETADKQWVVVDAKDQVLGRFSSHVAYLLRGKHKTNFTPHADCGDNVVVINAESIQLTGTKLDTKSRIWYTGYPGGQRTRTAAETLQRKPTDLIEWAVKGMLPKSKLGRQMFRNLYVYTGSEHPHSAQQPKTIDINAIK